MTIAILVLGMGLSFAVQSYFIKQNKKRQLKAVIQVTNSP